MLYWLETLKHHRRSYVSRSQQRPHRVLAHGGRRQDVSREDDSQYVQILDERTVRIAGGVLAECTHHSIRRACVKSVLLSFRAVAPPLARARTARPRSPSIVRRRRPRRPAPRRVPSCFADLHAPDPRPGSAPIRVSRVAKRCVSTYLPPFIDYHQ